jgi:pyridoxal phosphate enzyme (YggS family)
VSDAEPTVDAAAIVAGLRGVQARIDAAAQAAGRDPDSITLVGASKTMPAAALVVACEAGLTDLGENRAQELVAKAPVVADVEGISPRWHFIGRLQRNKVKALAPWVGLWESVDREPVAAEIARHAPGARILIEVSAAGEEQKGGVDPAALEGLVDQSRALGLDVAGLMTVPPLDVDPRRAFAELRDRADRLGLAECSMGMTGDFEIAVAEGATIVRVGRAIFGSRGEPPSVAAARLV